MSGVPAQIASGGPGKLRFGSGRQPGEQARRA